MHADAADADHTFRDADFRGLPLGQSEPEFLDPGARGAVSYHRSHHQLADVGKGINGSKKAMLTARGRSHSAHISGWTSTCLCSRAKMAPEEREFKDSWKFNIAAYRLAKLLRLTHMVPVSVEREVDGMPASIDWWVDNVAMDEKSASGEGTSSRPTSPHWNQQMDTIRIFDQLIYNMDRSQENLLITRDWSVWMIDHTRAFRKWPTLRNPAAITHCTPELLAALKSLRRSDVARETAPYLTAEEIDGLMTRRDLILEKLGE